MVSIFLDRLIRPFLFLPHSIDNSLIEGKPYFQLFYLYHIVPTSTGGC